MDSLTQAVLGGAVTYAVLGRKLGRRAALYGAALGTLPDLDVFIDFGGPVENMTYHRGVSHSIFVQALVTPLLAWLMTRLNPGSFKQWCLAIYLTFVTHSLADTFTIYGTQILWPLTDFPFSYAILFIVDPVYTLPLLAAFIAALAIGARALRFNAWVLVLTTAYLGWSAVAKTMVDSRIDQALAARGIEPSVIESSPAPLNTLLWRSVAVQGDTYFEIYASVFDDVSEVTIYSHPRNTQGLQPYLDSWHVDRLRWFTKGLYSLWSEGERTYIADLRMGSHDAYVFNFEVVNNGTLGSFAQTERPPRMEALPLLFQRILDPTVDLTPP